MIYKQLNIPLILFTNNNLVAFSGKEKNPMVTMCSVVTAKNSGHTVGEWKLVIIIVAQMMFISSESCLK
jgi:hypothetical protein